MARFSKSVALNFDAERISIGGTTLLKKMSAETFSFLLKAVNIPHSLSEEGTVSVNNVSLCHNLWGKCHFRFTASADGQQCFSRVNFVLDPDMYPGLKGVPRDKRLGLLGSFASVSLQGKFSSISSSGDGCEFRSISEDEYASDAVRVRYQSDFWHAVITIAYRDREGSSQSADAKESLITDLLSDIRDLEARVDALEVENKELRRISDTMLRLMSGLKDAHRRVDAPEGDIETLKPLDIPTPPDPADRAKWRKVLKKYL